MWGRGGARRQPARTRSVAPPRKSRVPGRRRRRECFLERGGGHKSCDSGFPRNLSWKLVPEAVGSHEPGSPESRVTGPLCQMSMRGPAGGAGAELEEEWTLLLLRFGLRSRGLGRWSGLRHVGTRELCLPTASASPGGAGSCRSLGSGWEGILTGESPGVSLSGVDLEPAGERGASWRM